MSRTAPRNMANSPLKIRMADAAVKMNMLGLEFSQKERLKRTGIKAKVFGRGLEQ